MSDSGSRGEIPAAPGGVSDMEDLEQRLADRMDTALTQRMDVMSAAIDQRVDALVDKLSSVLQGVSGGNRIESGGGGSAAAGGNQFAPGVQSGTPGGAEMSSIPGRPPTAVGPVGPQEGSLEVGGVDSPGGELASSVGGGGDFSGSAVYNSSLAKQLPRVQAPVFKGDRKEYLPFRADFLRTAALLELKGQLVGPQRVIDISKDSSELLLVAVAVVVAGEAAEVAAVEQKAGATAATGRGTSPRTAPSSARTSCRSAKTAKGMVTRRTSAHRRSSRSRRRSRRFWLKS